MSTNSFDAVPADASSDMGWLVIDPEGHPYSWHSLAVAPDEVAAWTQHEPNTALHQQLRAAGWHIRPGKGLELITGRRDHPVRASA
jgi:hypothetical protein